MRLGIAPGQVFLLDNEGEDAVGPTRGLVHVMRWHDFVFKAFPEVFKSLFLASALEDVHVFNRYFVSQWVNFDF